MKRSTIIILCIALSLLVMGAAVGVTAVAAGGLSAFRNVTSVTHPVEDDFHNITIQATAANIRILPSQDDNVRIVTKQASKITYSVTVQENTLTVKEVDNRAWYDHIGIFMMGQQVTLYLPAGAYGNLKLHAISGDVQVLSKGYTFAAADLRCSSGDLGFRATVSGNVQAKTSSGEIDLLDTTAQRISVSSTSGDITLSRCTANDILLSASSGEMELVHVTGKNKLQAKTTSGDIDLSCCDGDSIHISTTSGDVEGTLLSHKRFDVDSGSGSIKVPDSDRNAGACFVRTSSGDIHLRVESFPLVKSSFLCYNDEKHKENLSCRNMLFCK